VDKLVKVFLKDGSEKYILVHVEVQSHKGKGDLSARMFTYFYRVKDKYGVPITAIAIWLTAIGITVPLLTWKNFWTLALHTNCHIQDHRPGRNRITGLFRIFEKELLEKQGKDITMGTTEYLLDKAKKEERAKAEAEKLKSAQKMKDSGFDNKLIADILGLSVEQIEKL